MSSLRCLDRRHRSGPPTQPEVCGGDVFVVSSARGFELGEATRHELLCVPAAPGTRSSMRVKRRAKPLNAPFLKPGSHRDPTGLTGSVSRGRRRRLRFQRGALRHDAGLNIAPQRDDDPPGQCHNSNAARRRPTPAEATQIPLREDTGRLIPEPGPRHLHGDPPHRRQPARGHALVPGDRPTPMRRRDQPGQRPHLPAVAQLATKQFRGEYGRTPRGDPAHLRQPLRRRAGGVAPTRTCCRSVRRACCRTASTCCSTAHVSRSRAWIPAGSGSPAQSRTARSRSANRAFRRSRPTPWSASKLWSRFR